MASAATSGGHPSEVVQALKEVCLRIHDVLPTLEYAVRHSALASPAVTDVPVFRGFEDDPVHWVQLVDALAARHAWPEHLKRSFAVERLRDAARAWHLYAGHSHSTWASWSGSLIAAFGDLPGSYDDRFMQMRARRQGPGEDVTVYIHDKLSLLVDCDLAWVSPVARQYVLDGLADPIHAAVLTGKSSQLSLQAFIRLAAELQQTATRQAQELYQRAPAPSLAESASPKHELSNISLEGGEASSKTASIVNEDGVPGPKSPYQARHRPMVSSLLTRASVVGEPPSTHEEIYPECHQGPPQQRPDVLTLTPIPPSKLRDDRPSRFVDVTAPVTSTLDSVMPGSPLDHLNFSKVTAGDHVPFTTTCDMFYRRECFLPLPVHEKTIETDTSSNSSGYVSQVSDKERAIGTAQRHEDERKDMPVETSNQMASDVQTGAERREGHTDAPAAVDHVSTTAVEADYQQGKGNDSEEKIETFSNENYDHVYNSGSRTSLTQTDCKASMTRIFCAQDMVVQEVAVASSSTLDSLALTQARKEKMNRTKRKRNREETFNGLISCSCADGQARARSPHQPRVGARHRSVAECRGAEHYEVKAPSAAGGQSTIKETRTAADWKRRKKKR